MASVYAMMADGFEEVECLAVVDVLRRAGVEVTLVSMNRTMEVQGSHQIRVGADATFESVDPRQADVLFLPGGMPGTKNLAAHQALCQALAERAADGRRIAAICAAPSVLGGLGILEGKTATCYPGFESQLRGASYTREGVVTDGAVTTARGLGYALDLGLELVRLLISKEKAVEIKAAIQYDQF